MSCVVTGVAGFIGSHLAEKLIERGYEVLGIDSFSDYYSRRIKISNLVALRKRAGFRLIEGDLVKLDLRRAIRRAEYVFHLAAQPGVRASWGSKFGSYLNDNVLSTQRLLERVRNNKVKKFIYASSSSIYGDSESSPTHELALPQPKSPYGMTKLAGENLCRLYQKNLNVPVVILRYFTVYGPRQRPDMAFHRFIRQISGGHAISVYGDGSQYRDYTFVHDTVSATVLAMQAPVGRTYNVGSGRTFSLKTSIGIIGSLIGKEPKIHYLPREPGDVVRTFADTSAIQTELGYGVRTALKEGLRQQIAWQLRPS